MKLHLTSLAVGLLLPITAAASQRERIEVGSVHRIDSKQLQVCFKHTPRPGVGASLAIQRGYIPYKGSGATMYRTIGHARVAVVEDSCVTAALVDGAAKRYDRAVTVGATGSTD